MTSERKWKSIRSSTNLDNMNRGSTNSHLFMKKRENQLKRHTIEVTLIMNQAPMKDLMMKVERAVITLNQVRKGQHPKDHMSLAGNLRQVMEVQVKVSGSRFIFSQTQHVEVL